MWREMLNVGSSAVLHSFMVMKWGWTAWTLLCFMVTGSLSLVVVHQPAVVVATLGCDAVLPCELRVSEDEKMTSPPVLYWFYSTGDHVNLRLWAPSETFEGRVDRLDQNLNSLNQSVHLRSVRWADGGQYLCKLSVNTERNGSFRVFGDKTSLMIYDSMMFGLSGLNGSLLRCQVNVTKDAGFVLSVSRDGCRLQTVDSAGDTVAAQPHVTLSETVSLQGGGMGGGGGRYECQLHLKGDLITRSVFHGHLPEGGDSKENMSTKYSPPHPDVTVFPEPWLLYAALLLVPVAVLLVLVTAALKYR